MWRSIVAGAVATILMAGAAPAAERGSYMWADDPPAAALPYAVASYTQGAHATWIRMRGDHGIGRLAYGYRQVRHHSDYGTSIFTGGFVARGRCFRHKVPDTPEMILCDLAGNPRTLKHSQFQIDPAGRSAHLRMRIGGYNHSVDWTSTEVPTVWGDTDYIGPGEQVRVHAQSPADASGRLFGRRWEKGCVECLTWHEPYVFLFHPYGRKDNVRIVRDGQRARVSLRIPAAEVAAS
jgi:hypothetical protein